jgi:thioredoxin 1
MSKQIIELNYNNYQQELANSIVLVDFWAEWCYICKQQYRLMEELADENQDLFKVAKLNVDDNKVIASRLGVRNIPTLILFNNGQEVRRIIGLQSKEMLLNQIHNSLNTKKIA